MSERKQQSKWLSDDIRHARALKNRLKNRRILSIPSHLKQRREKKAPQINSHWRNIFAAIHHSMKTIKTNKTNEKITWYRFTGNREMKWIPPIFRKRLALYCSTLYCHDTSPAVYGIPIRESIFRANHHRPVMSLIRSTIISTRYGYWILDID